MDNECKYDNWSLDQLKAELKKRKAKTTGDKSTLRKRLNIIKKYFHFSNYLVALLIANFRLIDYDNLFIQAHAEDENLFIFNAPSFELYRDLNSSHILNLNIEFDHEFYQSVFNKTNRPKAVKLYNEKYLLSLRTAVFNNETYIRARVLSEFTKSLVYTIDIKVSASRFILCTQCECADGKGPNAHCKHILIVIEGLKDFLITRTYKIRSTCTDKLQTFHRPKKYTGSPVKAKDLKLPHTEVLQNKLKNFDPRPVKYRKMINYYTNFRNENINFASTVGESHPELQLFESANIYGVHLDHDYLRLHEVTKFILENDLEKISAEKRLEIEIATREQSDCKLWMDVRSVRINSSCFGKVFSMDDKGIKNYKKIAKDLLNPQSLSHLPSIQHGKFYEVHARKEAENYIGQSIHKCGIFISLTHPYLAGSPDGIIDDDTCIEIKCPYSAKDEKISPKTIDYLYICDEEKTMKLKKSHNYYSQIQGQMFCAEKKRCLFIIYTLVDVLILPIDRDEEFINKMVRSLSDFYNNYFKTELLEKFIFKNY